MFTKNATGSRIKTKILSWKPMGSMDYNYMCPYLKLKLAGSLVLLLTTNGCQPYFSCPIENVSRLQLRCYNKQTDTLCVQVRSKLEDWLRHILKHLILFKTITSKIKEFYMWKTFKYYYNFVASKWKIAFLFYMISILKICKFCKWNICLRYHMV